MDNKTHSTSKKLSQKVRPLNNQEIANFCNQYSMLLKSGIAPTEAADILLSDTKDPSARIILNDIQKVLHTGERFHIAVSMSNAFPPYVISMIRIGEESGNLDEVLDSLANFYEKEDALAESFRSAIAYPMIMIMMIFVIILVLITKVMPIFSQVFAQLGTSMNSFSQTLLNIGNIMNNWAFLLILILAILCSFFIYTTQTRHGHQLLSRISEHIRPLRSLYQDIAVSRFANGMALAIASGLDTYTSLNLLKNIVENRIVAEKIDICKEQIKKGDSFPEALKTAEIFSHVYTRMVLVGFRSGSMDKVLLQIAGRYEQHVNRKISTTLSVLEPTLVIILSVIVGLILLSVILPLMGIMSSIG